MRSQTITRTFLISSLLSLPLFTIACGDSEGEKTKTLEECEEACLEIDACDDTIAYTDDDYCADTCDEGWDIYEDLDCSAEFQAIATCRSAGNSCPVPDCLAETRDLEDCVDENTADEPIRAACVTSCSDLAACANAPDDYDVEACEDSCEGNHQAADDLGCGTEYAAILNCVDVCNPDSLTEDCAVELEEFTDCASN